MNFAFYSRVSNGKRQHIDDVINRQLSSARALIAPTDGRIVYEFVDRGTARSLPLPQRPAAARLLTALDAPDPAFHAVVITKPERTLTWPQCHEFIRALHDRGMHLWLPQVNGPIDPDNLEHLNMISTLLGHSPTDATPGTGLARPARSDRAPRGGRRRAATAIDPRSRKTAADPLGQFITGLHNASIDIEPAGCAIDVGPQRDLLATDESEPESPLGRLLSGLYHVLETGSDADPPSPERRD